MSVVGERVKADEAMGHSVSPSLPMRKRKKEDDDHEGESKAAKVEANTTGTAVTMLDKQQVKATPVNPRAREVRLEQNRKAARESRRRKKVMIEELQRSVIFFSRANGALKQQNDELTRIMMQAQIQIANFESGKEAKETKTTREAEAPKKPIAPAPAVPTVVPAPVQAPSPPAVPTVAPVAAPKTEEDSKEKQAQQTRANTVATQAMYETQGFPAAAARAAAQALNGSSEVQEITTQPPSQGTQPLPPMQPGATMQAMANFQQAAAAAMQVAMCQMKSIPGVNMSQLAAAPAGTNAQQAYTDTMTALAMQQAAAAAAAGMMPQGMQFLQPMMTQWQQQQQQQQQQASDAAQEADSGRNEV